MNYYQHHLGDYDSHTAHLDFAEDAAYSRLLRVYYRTEKPITGEIKEACRLVRARTKAEIGVVKAILQEFFYLDQADGCWHNKRADEELAKAWGTGEESGAKRDNEKERQRRTRERRKRMFAMLKDKGIVPSWDTSIDALKKMMTDAGLNPDDAEPVTLPVTGDVTPPVTQPVTKNVTPPVTRDNAPVTLDDTAIHKPIANNQKPLTKSQGPEDQNLSPSLRSVSPEGKDAVSKSKSAPLLNESPTREESGTRPLEGELLLSPTSAEGRKKAKAESKTAAVWAAFQAAYLQRYGHESLRPAAQNAAMLRFVEQVPADEAPSIAQFYVRHNDAWYVKHTHSVVWLDKNAVGLRTQWLQGRALTSTEAMQADRTAANANVWSNVAEDFQRQREAVGNQSPPVEGDRHASKQ